MGANIAGEVANEQFCETTIGEYALCVLSCVEEHGLRFLFL